MACIRRKVATFGLTLALCGLPVPGHSQSSSAQPVRPLGGGIDTSRVVDLTYSFDETTIYSPTTKPFRWQKESWGTSGGYWYASGRFSGGEHGGTHIDSPIHFGQGKATVDQIPVSRLIGPAVVIDIAEECERVGNYQLTVSDIDSWERKYGSIPDGAIVLAHTGWGKFWPDKARYFGKHFPGFSREAAEFLVTRRKINGVGIDTASLDHAGSKDSITHRTFNEANIYGLENIANLEKLPPTGAILIALPMKIKGGTGGPTRVIAILP